MKNPLNPVLIFVALFMCTVSILPGCGNTHIDDELKKARFSAVYNIFAFVMMNVFIMILPRLTDSLHPGNGGNPAFGKYDLDNNMRMVFYPAVLGWIGLGIWILNLRVRFENIKFRFYENA